MNNTKINNQLSRLNKEIRKLSDLRHVAMILFVFIILVTAWSGFRAIEQNYQLEKQISQLNQQNQLDQLTNTNIDLSNQYYKSNQYLELMARQNLGLAQNGETEILVPKSVAMKYVVPNPTASSKQTTISKPNNYQLWFNFFFHRTSP